MHSVIDFPYQFTHTESYYRLTYLRDYEHGLNLILILRIVNFQHKVLQPAYPPSAMPYTQIIINKLTQLKDYIVNEASPGIVKRHLIFHIAINFVLNKQ